MIHAKPAVKEKKSMNSNTILLLLTIGLFVVMYAAGCIAYADKGFTKLQTFLDILKNNAGLICVTCGMTAVMITGGIDISVGAVIAMECMFLAVGVESWGLPAQLLIPLMLVIGVVFGIIQGYCVGYLGIQPFIVTMAGMFFARGMTAIISRETIVIDNPVYTSLASARIYVLPGGFISVGVVIALVAAQFMQVAISAYMNAACASFFLTVSSENGMSSARRQMRDRLRQMGMDDSAIDRAGFGENPPHGDDTPGDGEGDGS
mgnify:CR=1 FL=1